ncbi:hypothetical protein F4813DRAFT_372619 [Daldinia decipiens]|uniref:uncharacterized protein n=1 Tax=Daldinia decipiens TaxID=326647 RepID=UPI0020C28AF0|nr:uncharacterized protein F4813DRAFT_372619 [Daldinia decipiens]KAI1653959.1 hypothetical protein F4813DRAFT_372619 [Daldinia decipiens]
MSFVIGLQLLRSIWFSSPPCCHSGSVSSGPFTFSRSAERVLRRQASISCLICSYSSHALLLPASYFPKLATIAHYTP